MFNIFKNKKVVDNPIEISVSGINPQTENEFLFFDFVAREYTPHLKRWFETAKERGVKFKPQYEYAIQQKLKFDNFKNPHTFPEYFENKFDYIAIDFETANKNRISACAIGLVYIKDFKIAYSQKLYIKPPEGEFFTSFHSNLHSIYEEDVENSSNFKELWQDEFSKYFNNNLIVFHNASMDLSVLKNLFQHYSISNFDFEYIDTMQLAEKIGYPKKLKELAEIFDVEMGNHHDPVDDAKVCAMIYGDLADLYPEYKELIKRLNSSKLNTTAGNYKNNLATEEVIIQNSNFVERYSVGISKLEQFTIKGSNFVVTGKFNYGRDNVEKFIKENGGILKPAITSLVNYVIIGEDYGWAKIQKIHDLNTNKGTSIRVLSELELAVLIKKYRK